MRSGMAGVLVAAVFFVGLGTVPSPASGGAGGFSASPRAEGLQPPGNNDSRGLELPLPDTGSGGGVPDRDVAPDAVPAGDNPAEEKNVTQPKASPPVLYDLSKLPEPVRRMRELIVKAARTGELDSLRPLLGRGATQTQLAISGQEGDPIAYLHSLSGDPGGQEILAILLDVLDAGFVDMDPGKPDETYVWPYFFSRPLDTLTAPQRVELLRIITAGDFADMKANGGYNFFRVGISPEGQWKFFVAGD